jgi:hypothetical protein
MVHQGDLSSTEEDCNRWDPLSPMLFIIAIDPLQKLLDKPTQMGLLHPIGTDPVKLRTSLYADDAALFVRPYDSDIRHMQQLLH